MYVVEEFSMMMMMMMTMMMIKIITANIDCGIKVSDNMLSIFYDLAH